MSWIPLGPSVLGQPYTGKPDVAGRIRDLAISPDGTRAYAASADGGVWLWGKQRRLWEPLTDHLRLTTVDHDGMRTNRLAVGALHVKFSPSPVDDRIWVGLGWPLIDGEPWPTMEQGTGLYYSSDGGFNWIEESLTVDDGHGWYAIRADPGNPEHLYAVGSGGVHERRPDGTWVDHSPRNVTTNQPISCTDIQFAKDDSGAVVPWIGIIGNGIARPARSGETLPTDNPSALTAKDWLLVQRVKDDKIRRICLGVSGDNETLYALTELMWLYQVVNGRAEQVVHTVQPSEVFYEMGFAYIMMGLAVDPQVHQRIYFGGTGVLDPETNQYGASLWCAEVLRAADGKLKLYAPRTLGGTEFKTSTKASSWIGARVHADIWRIEPIEIGNAAHIWVATDGGVFRSEAPLDRDRYEPVNDGLATVQVNYLAPDDRNDALMLVGTQDNGTQIYAGSARWRQSDAGDGGGVALTGDRRAGTHQTYDGRFFRTKVDYSWAEGNWESFDLLSPAKPGLSVPDGHPVAFAVPIVRSPNGRLMATATDRAWVSADGRTWAPWPAGGASKPVVTRSTPIVTLAWHPSSTVVYLATKRKLWFVKRIADPTSITINGLPAKRAIVALLAGTEYLVAVLAAADEATAGAGSSALWELALDTAGEPAAGATWTKLSMPQRAGADVDVSYHCGLIKLGGPASTDDVCYIGTSVGVWEGTRTSGSWVWTEQSNGLPETVVNDLALFRYQPPSGATTELLRAGTYGRGVWELPLSADPGPALYFRLHGLDAGRRLEPTVLPDVTLGVPNSELLDWTMSPDIHFLPDLAPPPPFDRPKLASIAWGSTPPQSWVVYDGTNAPLSDGDPVRHAQQRLLELYPEMDHPTLGRLTAATADAIKRFQREHRIPPSGELGITTWNALFHYPSLGPDPTYFEVERAAGAAAMMTFTDNEPTPNSHRVQALRPTSGTLFVTVHTREPGGLTGVRVAVIYTTLDNLAVGAMPDLPTTYLPNITAGWPSTAIGWWETRPQAIELSQPVTARLPGVAAFPYDFSSFPSGAILAVVVAVADTAHPLTMVSGTTSLEVPRNPQLACRVIGLR